MVERDGSQTSVWQDVNAYVPRALPQQADFDVIVIGAGITGLVTGLQLQRAGKKCLILEAHSIGFGTSGGTTAHINTVLDTPYHQVEKDFDAERARLLRQSLEDALDLVRTNIAQHNIACEFQEADAFFFAKNRKQNEQLKEIADGCAAVGLTPSMVAALPIAIPHLDVMRIGNQAKFHPLLYIHGIARAFEEAGGVILEHTTFKDSEREGELIRVNTSGDSYRAGALMYATHVPPGINILHLRYAPWRSYAIAAELEGETYPPDLYYDLDDPYHYYRSQTVDGKQFLIVGGEDHKTGEEINTESCFMKLIGHAQKYFRIKHVAYQWSSQYYEPVDGLAYIGHYPGAGENVYVATGFGGNGMIYSHVSALVISNKILGREAPYNDAFSPGRVKPVAGFSQFVSHNADVVRHFVGKFLNSEKLDQFASLAPGEGKVIVYEGERIALFKDTGGKLYAVSAICPHMKCSVQWNQTEQTWDCPCHGARYSVTGQVLNGPSTLDLEPVELDHLVEHH